MSRNGIIIILCMLFSGFLSIDKFSENSSEKNLITKLSGYNFFKGDIADLNPAKGVIPYDLNTPLFSDYAQKARFVKVPEGKKVVFHPKEVFDFPIGTILIKNFFYSKDERKPQKGRRIIETRLLIHEEQGWKALPYIWNDEQSEAFLDVAGGSKEVSWINKNGKKKKINYQIPNMNQCKGCHIVGKDIRPIGPNARQLNGKFKYTDGVLNQLLKWQRLGVLDQLPKLETVERIPSWNNEGDGTLDDRVRGWLDVNCGHCHREVGPANTSGLFLNYHNEDPSKLGIFKSPIAAGRGSGGFDYDIEPGHPEKSILVYRIQSTDPGEMMPEIGRTIVHEESLKLIKEWIKNMKASDFDIQPAKK